MTKINKTEKIDMGNISHIIYYESDLTKREYAISAYIGLEEVGKKTPTWVPGFVAGPDLVRNSYEDIIIERPMNDYEYLRSPSIAIPVTKNKIVTTLYSYYYFEDGPEGSPPLALIQHWPPFRHITKDQYICRVVSPTLLSFIEACLNTKRILGSTQDFESYGYLLLYHYLEHCIVLDQYTTYEQKGLELSRGDLLLPAYIYGRAVSSLSDQLISGVIPYILTEFVEKGIEYSFLRTQEGKVSLAHDPKILTQALEFLSTREDYIYDNLLSEVYLTPHSRGPSFEDSFQSIKPTLSCLKEKLC